MIQYKYNEEEYAKQIEGKGYLTKHHNYELTLLVKYWKKQGIKPKERKEKAYEFCKKYNENFNEVKYFKKIKYALLKGSRKDNPLIIIEKIPITDKEIEYINNINIGYDYKKILFSLLVNIKIKKEICKLKYGNDLVNYIGGKQEYFDDILKVSKVSNGYRINDIINILEQLKYVEVRTRGKIKLIFIKNIEDSDKVVFDIITYDNIGYYFDKYNGDERIIECINCGNLIKQSINKKKKYCPTCWKEIRRKYKTEKQREYRKLENVDT